jgi:acylphosphatase
MYVTLRSLGVEDSMKKRTFKAKLKNNNDDLDVTIAIKAESKKDLNNFLKILKKGAVFELKLEPLHRINDRSLDDFIEVEEA